MLLMDHIVTHGQLGKTLDCLALVICFLPALFLLFHAEHVTLGDIDKLKKRVFKPPVEAAVGNHDFPWLYLWMGVLGLHPFPGFHLRSRPIRAVGAQAVLPQVAGQPAGPCPGR